MISLSKEQTNMLVGNSFEDLSLEEMALTQGGAAQTITSSVPCASASSGWCSAGIVVSTIIYSIAKC